MNPKELQLVLTLGNRRLSLSPFKIDSDTDDKWQMRNEQVMSHNSGNISAAPQRKLSTSSPRICIFPIDRICQSIFPTALPYNGNLHLFLADTLQLRQEIPYLQTILDSIEWDRASRFKYEKDRNLFITAHGLLRIILGNLLCIPATQVRLKTGAQGKPALDDAYHKSISFSISHSGSAVAILLSSQYAVGVDVEYIRPIKDVDSIIHRYFHPQEISYFEGLPDEEKSKKFYQLWTQKEAVVKALGKGLFFPLDRFSVEGSDAVWKQIYIPEESYPPCFSLAFTPLPEYIVALNKDGYGDYLFMTRRFLRFFL